MSDNEAWRRELAERLRPADDWTIRPAPRPAADVAPMRPRVPRPAVDAATAIEDAPARAPVAPQPTPLASSPAARAVPVAAAPARPVPRWLWPLLLAAFGIVAAVAAWSLGRPVEPRVAGPVAPVADVRRMAPPVAAPLPVAATASVSGCDDPLAAAELSQIVRAGTAFAGTSARAAAPAALRDVRETARDGTTMICRAVLALELVDAPAGRAATTQLVSGPVDYVVAPGAVAGVPVFRVLAARAIERRLASAAVPPAPAVLASAAVAPPVAAAAVAPPVAATAARERPLVVARGSAPSAAPVRLSPPVPDRLPPPGPDRLSPPVVADRVAVPAVVAPDAPEVPDDAAADSARARATYAAILRSGDERAIDAANDGRDAYLRRSERCRAEACVASAYRRWVVQLDDIAQATGRGGY